MLLNQILLSCYFCKNPYSTKEDIEAKGDTNITLHCGLRFWQTWRRRWRTVPKLPKKCALRARKTREIEACTSAQGAQKKQEREALFRLSHCKRLTSTQPKPVKNSIMHTASEIFPSIQYRESHDQKKMLEVNATTGKSIVLIKSIFLWNVKWVIGCVS